VADTLYAIIHEADGDTIWRWQTGRKAKFVEYGGYHRARELADGSGAVLALWGSQYGRRGVPGDATPDAVEASVREAIERAGEHSSGGG
jgi:hypothetical protein